MTKFLKMINKAGAAQAQLDYTTNYYISKYSSGNTTSCRWNNELIDSDSMKTRTACSINGQPVYVTSAGVSPFITKRLCTRGETLCRSVVGESLFITSVKPYSDGVAMVEYTFTPDVGQKRIVRRVFSFYCGGSVLTISPREDVSVEFLNLFCATPEVATEVVEVNTAFVAVGNNDVVTYAGNLQRFNELTGLNYGRTAVVNDVHVYRALDASDDPTHADDAWLFEDGCLSSRYAFLDAKLKPVDLTPEQVLTTLDATYAELGGSSRLLTPSLPACRYVDGEYAVGENGAFYVKIDDTFFRTVSASRGWTLPTYNAYRAFFENAQAAVEKRQATLNELADA